MGHVSGEVGGSRILEAIRSHDISMPRMATVGMVSLLQRRETVQEVTLWPSRTLMGYIYKVLEIFNLFIVIALWVICVYKGMLHVLCVKIRRHLCGVDFPLQLLFGFECRSSGLPSDFSHLLGHLLDRLLEFFPGKCLLASLPVGAI